MFDAHCHFKSENSIICSAELLPQYINYPFDITLTGISEVGLDARFTDRVSMEKQIDTLNTILEYAGKNRIPVSLHCVRATGAMIQLLQKIRPEKGYCMWHGFTGSAETAAQLEKLGVLVSVGPRFRGSVRDLGYFVIETDYEGDSADEHEMILNGLYEKFAEDLGISVEQLEEICNERAAAFKNYRLTGKR